ncbi:MAG: hypothetical protein IT481_05490 [Gammaproteobacteria bacterium]|nr:hypothetical protein [Gammaproteobacteria bacterium]
MAALQQPARDHQRLHVVLHRDQRHARAWYRAARERRPLRRPVVVRLDVRRRAPVVADDAAEPVERAGGFEAARDRDAFLEVVAALEQLVHVEAQADEEAGPRLAAHGRDHVLQEFETPLAVAAPGVVAVVGRGREE